MKKRDIFALVLMSGDGSSGCPLFNQSDPSCKGGGDMPKLSDPVILALVKAAQEIIIALIKKGK